MSSLGGVAELPLIPKKANFFVPELSNGSNLKLSPVTVSRKAIILEKLKSNPLVSKSIKIVPLALVNPV